MTELLVSGFLFLVLLISAAAGLLVRPFLSERHRDIETVDLVRLVVTMLVTFAALVLGLLTTSVKATFDHVRNDVRNYAIDIIQLGQLLEEYGPETAQARVLLRTYTAAAIATTWTDEPPPPGNYYPKSLPSDLPHEGFESRILGDMLSSVEHQIRGLNQADPLHRQLATDSLAQYERLNQQRWRQIEEWHSSISVPFLLVLGFWLVIVFACFGLSAPQNVLVITIISLGALSIASAMFVILDLDTPFSGPIMISSEPLRDALIHLGG